jgi:type IV fimbrial biogenesis protein FimT
MELLITIVIIGILAATALPSLQGFIRNNRVVAESGDFKIALTLARSEAIKRNRIVAICASSDGATCAGGWSDGWIVFQDTNADGARANAEELIRAGTSDDDVAISSSTSVTSYSFNGRGLPVAVAANPTFSVAVYPCDAGEPYLRTIELNRRTGRVSVGKGTCT